ncbi:MAG: PAS domain-containing protein [Ferruginibacter sp.]
MNHNPAGINIVILSPDRENTLLLTAALQASDLKIKSIRAALHLKALQKQTLKTKPSVVFVDTAETNDRESFLLLRALDRSLPVIVITGKKNTKSGYAFLESGATDFIMKANRYDPLLLEKSVRFSIENKITAESLRLSNERYELVSKATNDMVWDWDLLNNKVFRSADGWDKVFGKAVNDESVYADSWWDRVHPDDKIASNTVIEDVLKNKDLQYFEIECRILRNDNKYATVVDRGYVVRNAAGEATRLIGATQDITEKKAAEERLGAERHIRQNEITNAVITALDQEKESLGKELHDNINQILATTKLYIEYALTNDSMRAELLTTAKGLVESAVGEIRNLSKSLLPPSLGEVGLVMALNELVESVKPVNSFQIKTDWGSINEKKLSEQLKLTVFRIIQEQLTNISKHAHAKKVTISLKTTKAGLSVMIKDDGKGFDTNEKITGVGLKNILSRAQLHNGKAVISAEKGKGCRLSILFKI